MQKIKQLSAQEIQKIAAGEVVERPSNIVKELIENSLDAHATQISLYIENGGKSLIRIVDNGTGMSREDAYMCIKAHTTSKISCVDDLVHINSFGFRGEALASICSVSKVILITKEELELQGIKLTVENGNIVNQSIASCNTGTDIAIRDIFYNVPARQKFLKTKETELRAIIQIFNAYAVSNQHVNFKLFNEDKLYHNVSGNHELVNRLSQIYDSNLASSVLKIYKKDENRQITVSGCITNSNYTRYDRNQIFLYVNKRWVKNHKLVSALLKGYQSMLQAQKYPAAFIFIELEQSQIDVNIHPRKDEVQFANPKIVENLIQMAVKEALEVRVSKQLGGSATSLSSSNLESPNRPYQQLFNFNSSNDNLIPSFKPSEDQIAKFQEILSSDNKLEAINDFTVGNGNYVKTVNLYSSATQVVSPHYEMITGHTSHDIEAKNRIHPKDFTSETVNPEQNTNKTIDSDALDYTIVGQVLLTYIIIQTNEGLTFIDQHAAHERILYEKIKSKSNEITRIKLLFPEIVQLTKDDLKILLPYLDLFASCGLIIEQISENEVVIQETPVLLKNQNVDSIIKTAIIWINESNSLDMEALKKSLEEKLHASLSCKAAIKAGDLLTLTTMHQIIKDLNSTANKLTCPHGRPTTWSLTTSEIEKKFKRDYKK